jgi:hypothetical protein
MRAFFSSLMLQTRITLRDGFASSERPIHRQECPPGSYKLFAFDNAESGSWLDPEWLKPYDSRGESGEVKESDKQPEV